MAKCKYCKKSAGFLKRKHKECSILYKNNKVKIEILLYDTFFGKEDMPKIKDKIITLAKEANIKPIELDNMYISSYNKIVKQFLYDGVLTHEEELKLTEFKDAFNFDQEFLDQNGLFQKFMKAIIIRDIAKGKMPNIDFDSNLSINLSDGEKIVWLFDEAELYEKKKLKIDKNKVWNTANDDENLAFSSVFLNDTAKIKNMKILDIGTLVITNKSSYFLSNSKKIKIKIKNISSLIPYQDGVGLIDKGDTKSFRIFKNIDGWFAYNVIFNLCRPSV